MQLELTHLQSLYPATSKATLETVVVPLRKAMAHYEINNVLRAAAFLAQAGHESAGFSARVENLNYSAKALRSVFKKYFHTDALANAYARKPQLIASRVYANRMGNGDEKSREGWTYRGRGFIQLTGKTNYKAFADNLHMTLAEVVPYLETPEGAAMSAAWFWNSRSLNPLADVERFDRITQIINGGQNGAEDRRAHYAKAKKLFGI